MAIQEQHVAVSNKLIRFIDTAFAQARAMGHGTADKIQKWMKEADVVLAMYEGKDEICYVIIKGHEIVKDAALGKRLQKKCTKCCSFLCDDSEQAHAWESTFGNKEASEELFAALVKAN